MDDPRLKKFYENVVAEDIILLYNLTSLDRIPKFKSAMLSSTSSIFGKSKISAAQSFSVWRIQTSQKCKDTRARNSISFGNLRKGGLLGLKTTLRKKALFNFFDKTILFVLPKIESLGISYIFDRVGRATSTLPLSFTSSTCKERENYEKQILYRKIKTKDVFSKSSTFFKKDKKKQIAIHNQMVTSYGEADFSVQGLKSINKVEGVGIENNPSLFFFTIGVKSSTFFPEGTLLSIFFDCTPGFSLSFCCTKIGASSFLRGSASKFGNAKPCFSESLRQSLRLVVLSTNREEDVKNQFASAFCFSPVRL